MKKTLSIVLCVLLVLLAVACSPETHKHTWDDGVKTLDATCTASGVETYTCTVCGETDKKDIPALGHTHAEDATPVTISRAANCLLEGYATFVCSRCNQEYQDVIEKDYTNHVYYDSKAEGTKDDPYYKPVTKDTKDYYRMSETAVAEKTQFTPASLVAYCLGCNHKITTITEPDTDGTKTTADDYNDILGTWILTATDTDGDKEILNFLVTKSDSTYSVKVTVMTIEDGVYVTEQGDGQTVDFDYATDGRTFVFSTPAFATLTDYASKAVVIGEDEDGLYITVEDLYEANEHGPSGYNNGDVVPMHNGDSLYSYTSETERTKIGSVAFSYDSTHKEHSYSAMSNALGFETFNIHASASTSDITPAHYKECSCGVKYLEEACGYDSNHTGTLSDADNQRVCYFCGYSMVSGVYGYCTVSDGTSCDKLMVKIGSEIVLPYTTYQFFNGENVKISGWTSFSENASETGAGKVKITETGAALVFAPVETE